MQNNKSAYVLNIMSLDLTIFSTSAVMERESAHPHGAERWFIRNRNDRYLQVFFHYCGASPLAGIEAREQVTWRRMKRRTS